MGFLRYSAVGALATGVHYCVLVAGVELLTAPPAPAAVVGALCGAAVSYAGNRRFTFVGEWPHRIAVPKFLVSAAVSAALSGSLVWIGSRAGVPYLISQICATSLGLVLGYVINKHWTFAK